MTAAEVKRQPTQPQTWFSEPIPRRDRTGERPWQVRKTRRDGVTQTYHVSDNYQGGPGAVSPVDTLSA